MATSYTLTINRAVVDRLAQDEAHRRVVNTTRKVFNRANVLTPVDTGRLRAGNLMRVRRDGATNAVGEVYNPTSYAGAVHDGRRAVTIRPRHKKALRFVVGGRVVYAKWARQPARRGRPWLLRALKEVAVPEGYRIG